MNTNANTQSKTCPTCGATKPYVEFHKEQCRRDGVAYRCKACQARVDRERHLRDREKRLEQQRVWYQGNAEARRRAAKEWVMKNPERRKVTKRKGDLAAYGLTPETYDALRIAQGNCCAICGGPPAGKYPILVVDHDHQTNAVRGLLCSTCNMAIGLLKDSPEVLRKAAIYLDRPQVDLGNLSPLPGAGPARCSVATHMD